MSKTLPSLALYTSFAVYYVYIMCMSVYSQDLISDFTDPCHKDLGLIFVLSTQAHCRRRFLFVF